MTYLHSHLFSVQFVIIPLVSICRQSRAILCGREMVETTQGNCWKGFWCKE